jgi:hypothetical protein
LEQALLLLLLTLGGFLVIATVDDVDDADPEAEPPESI